MTHRHPASGSTPDPVGELSFRVEVADAVIGYFSDCTGIAVEWEIEEYQEGGENDFVHKLRGRAKYSNLVLKRGVTKEDALLKWFFSTKEWDKRGHVTISVVGPDAKVVRQWAFAGAFPVKWQGPSLNANSTGIATETLEIAHRGFEVKS